MSFRGMARMHEITREINGIRDVIIYGILPGRTVGAYVPADEYKDISIGRIDGNKGGFYSDYPKFVADNKSVDASGSAIARACMEKCSEISYRLNEKWKSKDDARLNKKRGEKDAAQN